MNPLILRPPAPFWRSPASVRLACKLMLVTCTVTAVLAADSPALEVGLAVRDVTPDGPIWLAGYAARNHPSVKVDSPLLVEACAFRGADGERFVLVSLDNCEVSHEFTAPVLQELAQRHGLGPGRVMIISSHTHSAPALEGALMSMYNFSAEDLDRVQKYSRFLQGRIVEVVGAALDDLRPARLDFGRGRATFAMNRRVYRENSVDFGENPEGPVEWDVPVLRIRGTNDAVRAVLFGYACHGTDLSGDDFYTVSGDYMAYARHQLEAVYPGAIAMYITGMGADSNPSPRGRLLDAKRHGLELAGAIVGVLSHPLRPVLGPMRVAYTEVDLPFVDPPSRDQIEKDAQSKDVSVHNRAVASLKLLDAGRALQGSIKLPLAAIRFGDDLTFVAAGGEVVVDYERRLKRVLPGDHPWFIGYAYEVPCYIPSMRILKEGGYEAQSSLIYYGYYGPFRGRIEDILVNKLADLVGSVRAR